MEHIEISCSCFVSAAPQRPMLRDMVSALCIGSVEPSQMLAHCLMRTQSMEYLLGAVLSRNLYKRLNEDLFKFTASNTEYEETCNQAMLNELLTTRNAFFDLKKLNDPKKPKLEYENPARVLPRNLNSIRPGWESGNRSRSFYL